MVMDQALESIPKRNTMDCIFFWSEAHEPIPGSYGIDATEAYIGRQDITKKGCERDIRSAVCSRLSWARAEDSSAAATASASHCATSLGVGFSCDGAGSVMVVSAGY